jgi:hypothetical protein
MATKLRTLDPLAHLRIQAAHWIATRLGESKPVCRCGFLKAHRQQAELSVLEQVFDDAWERLR